MDSTTCQGAANCSSDSQTPGAFAVSIDFHCRSEMHAPPRNVAPKCEPRQSDANLNLAASHRTAIYYLREAVHGVPGIMFPPDIRGPYSPCYGVRCVYVGRTLGRQPCPKLRKRAMGFLQLYQTACLRHHQLQVSSYRLTKSLTHQCQIAQIRRPGPVLTPPQSVPGC